MKAVTTTVLLIALGAVVLAKPTPVERVGLAMSAVLTTGTAS